MRVLAAIAVSSAAVALTAGPARQSCKLDVVCIVHTVTAVLRSTAPPPSRGPLPPADIVFADRAHGFLGSTGGAIQATGDAGSTWHTVWEEPRTSFSWIGLAGDGVVVAAGERRAHHIVLTSLDGDRTWSLMRASVPSPHSVFFSWDDLRFQFVDRRVGFGWPNPYGAGDSGLVIRTTDGGAHWTKLATSFGVSSVHFVSERDGYATGSPHNWRRCYSELFRTSDSGETWGPVPGTCRSYELWGIDTPDPRHVYMAGGAGYWEPDKAFQAVIASADGALTWRQLYNATTGSAQLPIVDLHFADAERGWAETGSCKGGQNGPCGGEVLTTSDGGTIWHDTGHAGVVLATGGADRAWTCCDWSGVVWRTLDRGRTWVPLARPQTVSPRAVGAAWPWITASTVIGQLLSRDGGGTWQHYGSPSAQLDQPAPPVIRPGLVAKVSVGNALRISRDGGRTWTTRRPFGRGGEIDSISFADARHGLAGCSFCVDFGGPSLARTDDGGRTWLRVADAPSPRALAAAPGIAVMATESRGVAVSRDGGTSWNSLALPNGDDCGAIAAAAPRRIWVICEHSTGLDTSACYLLASTNAGSTWTRIDVRRADFTALAASPDGAGALLAIGQRWSSTAVQTIWKSLDGGRTWTETWIPAG